jgi:AbrB family looped-hinge helix DNA binding protein
MPFGNLNGMKSTLTIDKAGRMVLPQGVRKQFGLRTGSALEMKVSAHAITLYPAESKPALTNEDGLYVHEGKPGDTLLDAIDSARDARDRAVWGGSR